jgi:methyl-accepting chemotaxis protein
MSSNEQLAGISQVNQAVTQIDDITQQNAALAEEAAANSMAMSEQSAKMTQLISFFKVGDKSSSLVARPHHGVPIKTVVKPQTAALVQSSSSYNNGDDWEEF